MVLGSVSTNLLNHASCPVLVVKKESLQNSDRACDEYLSQQMDRRAQTKPSNLRSVLQRAWGQILQSRMSSTCSRSRIWDGCQR